VIEPANQNCRWRTVKIDLHFVAIGRRVACLPLSLRRLNDIFFECFELVGRKKIFGQDFGLQV
jgi:hypothetical protein